MHPLDCRRGPLTLEALEPRIAPVVFVIPVGGSLVYDLGGGAVGALRNTGLASLSVDITDTTGGAADVINSVTILGDGAAFRASGRVGAITDGVGSFNLGTVETGVAVTVLAAPTAEVLDGAVPTAPFVSGVSATGGGMGNVTIDGNLTGNLRAVGGGNIGNVAIGGQIIGPVTIEAPGTALLPGTIGTVTVTGNVNAAGGAVTITSGASIGNASFGGMTGGAMTIRSNALGNVGFTGNVTTTGLTITSLVGAVGNLTFGGTVTGPVTATSATTMGTVAVTGTLDSGTGAVLFNAGTTMTQFTATTDVVGNVTVQAGRNVTNGVAFGGNITGRGGVILGNDTPSLTVAGTTTPTGGNLLFQADEVTTVTFGDITTTAGASATLLFENIGPLTTGNLTASVGGTSITLAANTMTSATLGTLTGTIVNNLPTGFAVQNLAPGEFFVYDLGSGNVGAVTNTGTGTIEVNYTDTGGDAADVIHRIAVLASGGAASVSGPIGVFTDLGNAFNSTGIATGQVVNVTTVDFEIVDTDGNIPATPFAAAVVTGGIADTEIGGSLTGAVDGGGGPVGDVLAEGTVNATLTISGLSIDNVTFRSAVNTGVGTLSILSVSTLGDVIFEGAVQRNLTITAPGGMDDLSVAGLLDSSVGATTVTVGLMNSLTFSAGAQGNVLVNVSGSVPNGVLVDGNFVGSGGISIGGNTPTFEITGNAAALGADTLVFEALASVGTLVDFGGTISGDVRITFDDIDTGYFRNNLTAFAGDILEIAVNTANLTLFHSITTGDVRLTVPQVTFLLQPNEFFFYDLTILPAARGVIWNTGTSDLWINVTDRRSLTAPVPPSLPDIIGTVFVRGDGGSLRATGAVGDVTDSGLGYNLGSVTTGVAIVVPLGAVIGGDILDGALPALPVTPAAGTGGVGNVDTAADLRGTIAGGTGPVGNLTVLGDVIGPAGATGSAVGDVTISGDVTGAFTLTATGAAGIGFVRFLGDVDATGGAAAITASGVGADLQGLFVAGDVLAGLSVVVNDAIPGGLTFGGDYIAAGANTISAGGKVDGISFAGDIRAVGTSSLVMTIGQVPATSTVDFFGDLQGEVSITLTNLSGNISGTPLGADVTFYGTVFADRMPNVGDTMTLVIGASATQAAGTILFMDDVGVGSGLVLDISGFAYNLQTLGSLNASSFAIVATTSTFGSIGSPNNPQRFGNEVNPFSGTLVRHVSGSAYIDFFGESLYITVGLNPGPDGEYGTLDDIVVNPNAEVGGAINATGNVVIHAAGDVMTGRRTHFWVQTNPSPPPTLLVTAVPNEGDYIVAGGNVFITSFFGDIGRNDVTTSTQAGGATPTRSIQSGGQITLIAWFGTVNADIEGGTVNYVAAGTLPGDLLPGAVPDISLTSAGNRSLGFSFRSRIGATLFNIGDNRFGTGDDVSLGAVIAGPDGLVGTADDNWLDIGPAAQARIIALAGADQVLGRRYHQGLNQWFQDDTFGIIGTSDRGANINEWRAALIRGFSGASEIRGVMNTTGNIGVHTPGTDRVDHSQDDNYQGIVSLHTLSGNYTAGGDIILIHATNFLGVINDFASAAGPVFTNIVAGGRIWEVSARGMQDPRNPAAVLDGHITSRITGGTTIDLVLAGGGIYSADQENLSSGEIADTEIAAPGGIQFLISGSRILGTEVKALSAGQVYTYTDSAGVAQQLLIRNGFGTLYKAFGVITDLELTGSGVRVLTTGSLGDVVNLGGIESVITGIDPGGDGILGTADDVVPGSGTGPGADGIWGTTDDLGTVTGGRPNAGIFSVTSAGGTVNRVIATGTIAMVAGALDINQVTTVGGTIGMTAAAGILGIGGFNGSATGLLQTATAQGLPGSIVAQRNLNVVQAVSTGGFSFAGGGWIAGNILALNNINTVRANYLADGVSIQAGNNVTSVIQYASRGGLVPNVFVAAGLNFLGRPVTGDVTRVLVGVTRPGVGNPGENDVVLSAGAAISVSALRDVVLVRHTDNLYGFVNAGRDVGRVISFSNTGGVLAPFITAGRDIAQIRSSAFIGSGFTPQLSTTSITAGRTITDIFARADIAADISAGLDLHRVVAEAGFFDGSATAQRDILLVRTGGQHITAGNILRADVMAGDDLVRVESYLVEGDVVAGFNTGVNGNLEALIARGASALGFGISGDVTVGGYARLIQSAGGISGNVTVGRFLTSLRAGTRQADGTVVIEADVTGDILVGAAVPSDLVSFFITGDMTGSVVATRDILSFTALGRVGSIVAAYDDILVLNVGAIGDFDGASLISAGFSEGGDGVFDAVGAATSFDIAGDDTPLGDGFIGSINVRPRGDLAGATGDVVNVLVRATGFVGPTTLPAGGGGTMTFAIYSAGFGPGLDGAIGTGDDTVLRSASVGSIGSSTNRFDDVDGYFLATGNIAGINSDGDLGVFGDLIWAGNTVGPLRARGDLYATVAAANDVTSITARNIYSPLISAGFGLGADGLIGTPDDTVTATAGDLGGLTLLGSDIIGTTIRTTDDIVFDDLTGLPGRISTPGGGTIAAVFFSAGYGPGLDGVLGTADDVVLRSGSIGHLGSATRRFASIDGTFQATGSIFDLNSAGALGVGGDQIRARVDVGTLRAGGALAATVAAGDDIAGITAGSITSPLISAGFTAGANGLFETAGDDAVTGLLSTIGPVSVTAGDIVGTMFRSTGNLGPTTVAGAITGAAVFSAGFNPVDGIIGNGNDVALFQASLLGITANGAGGLVGTYRATNDIASMVSGGILGTVATTSIFAGDDIALLRSRGNLGAIISAGTLSGTGVISRIDVNEPNDFGGPDPTILTGSTITATQSITLVTLEGLLPGGVVFAPAPGTLIADTDGDGF